MSRNCETLRWIHSFLHLNSREPHNWPQSPRLHNKSTWNSHVTRGNLEENHCSCTKWVWSPGCAVLFSRGSAAQFNVFTLLYLSLKTLGRVAASVLSDFRRSRSQCCSKFPHTIKSYQLNAPCFNLNSPLHQTVPLTLSLNYVCNS